MGTKRVKESIIGSNHYELPRIGALDHHRFNGDNKKFRVQYRKKRLNVFLSRRKCGLIMVGNPRQIWKAESEQNCRHFRKLIIEMSRLGLMTEGAGIQKTGGQRIICDGKQYFGEPLRLKPVNRHDVTRLDQTVIRGPTPEDILNKRALPILTFAEIVFDDEGMVVIKATPVGNSGKDDICKGDKSTGKTIHFSLEPREQTVAGNQVVEEYDDQAEKETSEGNHKANTVTDKAKVVTGEGEHDKMATGDTGSQEQDKFDVGTSLEGCEELPSSSPDGKNAEETSLVTQMKQENATDIDSYDPDTDLEDSNQRQESGFKQKGKEPTIDEEDARMAVEDGVYKSLPKAIISGGINPALNLHGPLYHD